MFEKQAYREACDRLTLDAEKLEEMITMTENTNTQKRLSRPLKTVLIAAACVAVLCITAFAAPAVQKMLFTSYTITTTDGNDIKVSVVPAIETYSEDGRNYLVVGDETFDITDALEKDGSFELQTEDGHEIRVDKDGWVTVTGEHVNYTFNPNQTGLADVLDAGGGVIVDTKIFTDGEAETQHVTVDNTDGMTSYTVDGEALTSGVVGTYEITTGENGKMVVSDDTPTGEDISYTVNPTQDSVDGVIDAGSLAVDFTVDGEALAGGDVVTYHITTTDENGEVGSFTVDGEALTGGVVGTYRITTDENGEMVVSDDAPTN